MVYLVGNKESIRHAHLEPEKRRLEKRWSAEIMIEQSSYTSKAHGSMGPSLRRKASVFDDNREIIGIVSVGFMMKDI
ncbi:hypothetical protein ACFSKI_11145 [Pseudogracilibacillus auburnensis]|nr:hypothetical protein [Pseudogracilibacillus auburnensis]MBO1001835.1 hypothetical protein [Pseudogracilibacillus auburnensis]